MPCPVCEGELRDPDAGPCPAGCREGYIEIPHCPQRAVNAPTRRLLQLCDFADKGRLPLSGGVLDQTQGFLDVLRFYDREVSQLKAASDPWGLRQEE